MGRLHGLDACRAAAMMLGLFFHGAISFMQSRIPWAIRDRSTHGGVDAFVWICHSFRMPLFFLLAGFFGRLVLERGGPVAFIGHRTRRLLVPFGVALGPTVASLYGLWAWGWSKGEPGASPPVGVDLPESGARVVLQSPAHLWFLYYLLMLSLLLLGASVLSRSLPLAGFKRGVDAGVRFLIRYRLVPLVLAVPTAACLHYMETLAADTPVGYVPQLRILAYYGIFAGFGWLLHRQTALLEALGGSVEVTLGVAALILMPLGRRVDQVVHAGRPLLGADRALALYLAAFFGWSLVIVVLGVFIRWAARPRPWVAYLSDASYWCYLVHLPVVVLLQILVAGLDWYGPLKYVLVMAGTVSACLLSYQAFVRYTLIGATLHGARARPVESPVTP